MPSAPGSLDEGDAVNEVQRAPQQESPPPVVETLPEEPEERVLLREKVTAESNEGIVFFCFFFSLVLKNSYYLLADYTNGDSDVTESNSLEEDLQKAISTAERRKVTSIH